MRKILEDILQEFRPCFSRQATYAWFALIVFGLIIRLDHAGVTSIVRWLFLAPTCCGTFKRVEPAGFTGSMGNDKSESLSIDGMPGTQSHAWRYRKSR